MADKAFMLSSPAACAHTLSSSNIKYSPVPHCSLSHPLVLALTPLPFYMCCALKVPVLLKCIC